MRLDRHTWLVILGVVILPALGTLPAAASHPACEPSPEVEQALAPFSAFTAEQARQSDRWDEFDGALLELIASHPYDVHVHRRYQDLHRGVDLENLVERYRGQSEERPEDPASQYLYGRILLMLDRPEAQVPLAAALSDDPGYPWSHFALARFFEVLRPDAQQAQVHLAAFIEQCPESPVVLSRLSQIDDPGMAQVVASALRAQLAASRDPELVPRLRAVWAAEFKTAQPDQHAAVRERVRADLALLRTMEPTQTVLHSLLEGYGLIGDDDGTDQTIATLARSFPGDETARLAAVLRFNQKHTPPGDGDSSPEAQAYYRELAEASERWARLWPDDPEVELTRFRAIAELAESPPDSLLASLDALLEKAGRRPDYRTEPPLTFQIAQILVRDNLALDRVPGLVQQGLQQLEAELPRVEGEGAGAASMRAQLEHMLTVQGWTGREALFDAYLKQDRLEDARSTLADMDGLLTPSSDGAGAAFDDEHQLTHLRASWWRRRAALARAEGQGVDALLYYQAALASDPLAPDSPREAASDLWRTLGAGEAALRAWESAEGALDVPFGIPVALELPEFEFRDFDGRSWKLSDLRGRVVLINVWATWCPPCLVELPWIEKLHQRIQGRPDLALLTLNVDENRGVVEPLLRERGYTFPVVFAFDYLRELWGSQWTIPTTWVVDPEGTARLEARGFASGDDRWVEGVLSSMQRLAREHP